MLTKKTDSKGPSQKDSGDISGDSDAGYESSDSYKEQKVKLTSQGSERRKTST